ncbi:MAG: DUF2088 domain-containing protein [candidate division NC10 bacterium]|nr:DUF2088 domain-containing protein [candidate division NC10 bacterium]
MDFPSMVRIRQTFETPAIPDVAERVRAELRRVGLPRKVKPGSRVAIAVGSRGIACIPAVAATLVSELKALGAKPFIVPAMGSHGAATAPGQKEVLEGLGVTEEAMGAPIQATMEVAQIGELESGMPVYMDRNAHGADAIIVANRIKPHSVSCQRIGSGVMKIIAIGLGKQKGCSTIHRYTWGFPEGPYDVIEQVARMAIERSPLILGIAVLDNAYARPARIVALEAREIPEIEPRLFREAMSLMASLPTDELDVLIVERMGKNISPAGLDPFVIGDRLYGDKKDKPRIKRVAVLDLTEESHGNAVGVGAADIISLRLFTKIDRKAMYMNSISGSRLENSKIPVIQDTDREAVEVALKTIGTVEPQDARVIRIRSTLELDEMYVSRSLAEEVARNPRVRVAGEPQQLSFDEAGNLL